MNRRIDVELLDTGDTVLFRAVTPAARAWIREHSPRGYWAQGAALSTTVEEAHAFLTLLCAVGLTVVIL